MNAPLISIDKAARTLDMAVCEVCNLCGDLRMRSDGSDEDQEYRTESARLLQQELRHMRDTYLGFKEAVDTALRDHEIRLRSLQQTQYLTLGGGAVVGWIFSVVLRMFFK